MFYSAILSLCTVFLGSPYQNGSVGLQLDLPENAAIIATSNTPPSCLIVGGNPSNPWHLRLDRLPNNELKTPQKLALEARHRRVDPTNTKVIADTSIQIGSREGWWILLDLPDGDHRIILGWLVIPIQGQQYIMANLLTSPSVWESDKSTILHTLRSLVPLDPVALMGKKLQGLDAATKLLANLNEKTLRPLVGFNEWRRIRVRDETGHAPKDIGYASISIVEGFPHEYDTEGDEEPNGLVVNVRSRVLINPETKLVVDTNAQYWLSWDGKESRWWNRTTRWIDRAKVIDSETGIRTRPQIGSPSSTLLVFQEDLLANTIEEPFKKVIEEPWLPRPLAWVIGPLLANAEFAQQFVWQTFDNIGTKKIITRTDSITSGKGGTRTIKSRFGESDSVVSTIINHTGHLIEQDQPNGTIITGSTEDELRGIWEPQKLW